MRDVSIAEPFFHNSSVFYPIFYINIVDLTIIIFYIFLSFFDIRAHFGEANYLLLTSYVDTITYQRTRKEKNLRKLKQM